MKCKTPTKEPFVTKNPRDRDEYDDVLRIVDDLDARCAELQAQVGSLRAWLSREAQQIDPHHADDPGTLFAGNVPKQAAPHRDCCRKVCQIGQAAGCKTGQTARCSTAPDTSLVRMLRNGPSDTDGSSMHHHE